MQAIAGSVAASPGHPWTYEQLAQSVYDTKKPTRAQRSAVARAVLCLHEHGAVEVMRDSVHDARLRVVTAPSVQSRVLRLVEGEPNGMTHEQLAEALHGARAGFQEMAAIGLACRRLEALGDVWFRAAPYSGLNERGVFFREVEEHVVARRVLPPPTRI